MWPTIHMGQFMVRRQGLRLYLEVWEPDQWTGTGFYPRFLRWLS